MKPPQIAGTVLFLLLSSFAATQQPLLESIPQQYSNRPFVAYKSVAPYWTLEPGWHTEIELGNNLVNRDITVHPVLTTFDGRQIELDAAVVRPGEMRVVDLRQSVQAIAANLVHRTNSFGSIILRYDALSAANLYASVMIYRDGTPVAFHMPAEDEKIPRRFIGRDGVWWLPRPSADGYVIVTNPNPKPVTFRILLRGADGRAHETTVALGPRQTRRDSIRDAIEKAGIESAYGSIAVPFEPESPLQVAGVLFDETTGFAALMAFTPKVTRTSIRARQLLAPMVALSSPDRALSFPDGTTLESQVFLLNVGPDAVTPTVALNWRGPAAGGRTPATVGLLIPGELKVLNLSALQQQGLIPLDAHWASIVLSFYGDLGDIVALTASYDSTGRYGLQSPFSYSVAPRWKGGRWRVDSDFNTLLATGNAGTEPTAASVVLYYNKGAGKYEMPETPLAPGEPLWVNVGQLIRNQTPDKSGHTLPLNANSGMFEFIEAKSPVPGHLYEGRLVIDKTFGHAVYACSRCCYMASTDLYMNNVTIVHPGSDSATLWGSDCCTGVPNDLTNFVYDWYTQNSNIATISIDGLLTSVGAGATDFGGYIDSFPCEIPLLSCSDMFVMQPGARATVRPSISGPNTVWWFNGQNPNSTSYPVSITLASSAGSSTTWSVPAGATRINLSTNTGAQTTVTSTGTHFSGTNGDISVVATANGVASAPHTITSRTPWKLVSRGTPVTQCFFSPTNYISTVSYDLHDNLDDPMTADVSWNEVVGSATAENGSNWVWGPSPMGATTNPLEDLLGAPDPAVHPNMTPLPTCSGQNLGTTRYMSVPQTIRVGTNTTGAGAQVQVDTLGYYVDHGQHDSIQVPSRPPQ